MLMYDSFVVGSLVHRTCVIKVIHEVIWIEDSCV
jgi:hypothetical protein